MLVRKTSMRDGGMAQVRVRRADPREKMSRIFVDVWAGRHRTRNHGWWEVGVLFGTHRVRCADEKSLWGHRAHNPTEVIGDLSDSSFDGVAESSRIKVRCREMTREGRSSREGVDS